MPTILVFDPGHDDRLAAVSAIEQDAGIEVVEFADGDNALQKLRQGSVDLMVADITEATLNDGAFLRTARREHPTIPIILLTADDNDDQAAVRGLLMGAARFLPRGRVARSLASTVRRVLELTKSSRRHARLLDCLTDVESRFELVRNEREMIPILIGHLVETAEDFGLCTPRDRLHLALSLDEALTNALMHGNLEIPSELRESDPEGVERLISQRMTAPPYRNRTISVRGSYSNAEATFVIHDQGAGFDPSTIPDPTHSNNLTRPTGRGLFLIQAFMDEVAFNERGNEIRMTKRRPRPEECEDRPTGATETGS